MDIKKSKINNKLKINSNSLDIDKKISTTL